MAELTAPAPDPRSRESDGPSPYKGPDRYLEADAKWFFGRGQERKLIISHLRTSRLTLLYAESGVGKSSLLRAGVAARLMQLAEQSMERRGTPGFIPVVFDYWKDEPLDGLIAAISERVTDFQARGRIGPDSHPQLPARDLLAALRAASDGVNGSLLVILDQFEEYLGARRDDPRSHALRDQLAACINSAELRAHFLIGLREDAYGKIGDFFGGQVADVYANYIRLGYLTRAAARESITRPVLEVWNGERPVEDHVTIDDGLADAVLDGVMKDEPPAGSARKLDGSASTRADDSDEVEASFLQLVMDRLWRAELDDGSARLRLTTLKKVGGVRQIVRAHFDDALRALSDDEDDIRIATEMFKAMVTASGTKIAWSAPDLANYVSADPARVTAILTSLDHKRIVRSVEAAPGSSDPRYEVFHDKFTAPILDLLNDERHARLETSRKEAEEAAAKSQRDADRNFHIALGAVVALLLVILAVGVAVVGLFSARSARNTANREKHAALLSSRSADQSARHATELALTTEAQSLFGTRPDVALLLLLAADQVAPQRDAQLNLLADLQSVKDTAVSGILHGHTDAVESVAFSPTQQMVASGSADRTVRFWRVTGAGHYPLGPPLSEGGPVLSVAFSPDGAALASGTFNRVVIWDVRSRRPTAIPYAAAGAVDSVAFGQRDHLIAAAGSNGTAMLVDTTTRQTSRVRVSPVGEVRSVALDPQGGLLAAASGGDVSLFSTHTNRPAGPPLRGSIGTINGVAFSPDGRTIAAAGGGRVELWNLTTRAEIPPVLRGPSTIFYSLAFDPRGDVIAAGGGGVVARWSTATHHQVGAPLFAPRGAVYSVAFNRNGTMLASAGADRMIRLWTLPVDLRFETAIPTVSGANGNAPIWTAVLSADGGLLASAGPSGVIHVLNLTTGQPEPSISANSRQIHQLAFDPRARLLAAAGTNGKITLWNPVTGRPVGTSMQVGSRPVYSIAFDPSGTILASGDGYRNVRLWNVATQRPIALLRAHLGPVYALAFRPDGTELASGGGDRTVLLWRIQSRKLIEMIPQDNAVFSLAFSQDGRILGSGGADDTVRLWTLTNGGRYRPGPVLARHTSYVRSIAFAAGGMVLASGSSDNTIRLWDVATGKEIGNPFTGHTKGVESVGFSPRYPFLVSGSDDGTVREWPVVSQPPSFTALRQDVCALVGAGLSRPEWAQYAPGVKPLQICPRTTTG